MEEENQAFVKSQPSMGLTMGSAALAGPDPQGFLKSRASTRAALTQAIFQKRRALRSLRGAIGGDVTEESRLLDGETHRTGAMKDLHAVKDMILGSKINILLVLVPLGIVAGIVKWNPIVVFFINFFAMIPVASILGDATEILAEHLGETIGGLLNATFGNAVEAIVMIFSLQKGLVIVVQTSLIGSIFSNALLVLGCAFVANGIYYPESTFNTTATSANVSLLILAGFVMLLPAHYSAKPTAPTAAGTKTTTPAPTYPGGYVTPTNQELTVSRACAIVLMLLYICLLIFVLYTHSHVMQAPSEDLDVDIQGEDDKEEEEEPEMTAIGAGTVLLLATVLVSFLSEYLVAALDPMATTLGMSQSFVGLILLPIIGNAVEHLTAIRMALDNKMDVALSIAIGSATQVAMFVVPLAVLLGWMMKVEFALDFNAFEVQMFLYSSIIIFVLVSDGSSNWLEGAMLLGLYLLIAIAVWYQN